MGTNYYLRKIPSKERKKELYDAIGANDYSLIDKLKVEMYNSIQLDDNNNIIGGEIHLGKRSGGWKFLWNPNIFMIRSGHMEDYNGRRIYVPDPSIPKYTYPLTKKGIKEFIDREDVEIYDEYGEKQDKEEFWNMAINWTTWKDHETGEVKEAWDADSYDKEFPKENKFSCQNEYTDFLESLGYKLSFYKADFYSDGLRFSTSTEFS